MNDPKISDILQILKEYIDAKDANENVLSRCYSRAGFEATEWDEIPKRCRIAERNLTTLIRNLKSHKK